MYMQLHSIEKKTGDAVYIVCKRINIKRKENKIDLNKLRIKWQLNKIYKAYFVYLQEILLSAFAPKFISFIVFTVLLFSPGQYNFFSLNHFYQINAYAILFLLTYKDYV